MEQRLMSFDPKKLRSNNLYDKNVYQFKIRYELSIIFKQVKIMSLNFFLNLYIYPPDSQESDGGATHRVSNYPNLLPEMSRYCCRQQFDRDITVN